MAPLARRTALLLLFLACGPGEDPSLDGGNHTDGGHQSDGGQPDGGNTPSEDGGVDAGTSSAASPLSSFGASVLGPDSISLAWAAGDGEVDGFELERGGSAAGPFSPLFTAAPGTSSYVDSGLSAGATYAYRARAFNASGASAWSEVRTVTLTQTAVTAPDAPSQLAISSLSPTSLQVSWLSPAADVSVEIERAIASTGPFVRVHIADAGASSFDDSGLSPAQTYWYRVRALRGGLSSADVGPASGTTPQVPAPPMPGNLAAVQEAANGQSTVRLTWTDVAAETHYEVQRSVNGTDWGAVVTVPANASSWIDLAPAFGGNSYRLRAINAGGASEWASVDIYAGAIVISYFCPGPTGSSASVLSETSVRIAWTFDYLAQCGIAAIERADSAEGPFVELNRVFLPYLWPNPPPTSHTFDDTTATPGSTYFYRVRHIAQSTGWAHSGYTTPVSVQLPSSLAPPTDVTPTVVSSSAAEFRWTDPSSDETGFAVELATAAGGPFAEVFRVPANTTLSHAQGFSPGTQYWVRVRTLRGAAVSAPSAAVAFTTASVLVLRTTADVTVFQSTALSASQNDRDATHANFVGCLFGWTLDIYAQAYLFHHCSASVLRFDTQQLAGRTVLAATLRLTPGGIASGPLSDATYAAFALTGAWNPATVTFNTLPPLHPDGWAIQAPTSSAYSLFNVTSVAQRWASGALGHHGLYVQHFPIGDRLPPNNADFQEQTTPYCSLEQQCGSLDYVPTLIVEYL